MSTPDPRPSVDPLSTGAPGRTPDAPAATPPATPAPATERRTGRAIGRTVSVALLVFVTVVLVLFVVFNTEEVPISLVFTDVRAPLVVALLIAAALGGLIVGLLDAVMSIRGRRRNR